MKIIRQFWRALAGLAIVFLSVAAIAQTPGTITYIHNDLPGSPAAATNAAGTVIWREAYSGYGERLKNESAGASNKVWYTSRHQDEDTGLVYMGARYYDPGLGRFLSVDSGGFDKMNVHSFNRYGYANNNPYKYLDPDGRNAVTAFGGVLSESYNFATGQGFNSSMVAGALQDGYNGEGAGFWRSAGEDALAFGGGALGAAAKAALAGRAARAAEVASAAKGADPSKLAHIFGQERHNLNGVVNQFGSEEKAYEAIQKATEAATTGSKGVFQTTVKVGTETVTVRGAVVDGAVKIGTAFVP